MDRIVLPSTMHPVIKKIVVHLLMVLTGLLLGFTVGFYGVNFYKEWSWNQQSSPEAARVRAALPTLARLGLMEAYVLKEKDLPGALLAYRDELSSIKQQPQSGEFREAVSLGLGFVYLRLASWAQQNGQEAQAGPFMTEAKKELRSIGWKDVSDAALSAALDRRLKSWPCCAEKSKQ